RDHQQESFQLPGLDSLQPQIRVLAESLLEFLLQGTVLVETAQTFEVARPLEHRGTEALVEIDHVVDAVPACQTGGDDGSGARSGDVVEVLMQWLADDLLDSLQKRERQNAADAAAIESEHLPL